MPGSARTIVASRSGMRPWRSAMDLTIEGKPLASVTIRARRQNSAAACLWASWSAAILSGIIVVVPDFMFGITLACVAGVTRHA